MLRPDPALPTLLKRGIKRGFLTLWRDHEWSTSLGSLLGIIVLLQLLLLGLIGIAAGRTLLLSAPDLTVEIRASASRGETQRFVSSLRELPTIANVDYITREQALARAEKENTAFAEFLEASGIQNPFPDTVNVTLFSLKDFASVSSFLALPEWKNIVEPTFLSSVSQQEQRVHELLGIARGGRTLVELLLIIAGIILLSTIVELTRRSALLRSEEVLVERLVGANALSIFLPFAAEATVLLWLGIAVSALALLGFLALLPSIIPPLAEGGGAAPIRDAAMPLLIRFLPLSFALEIIFTPLLAAAGSWLGIRSLVRSPSMKLARH
jgi:cell division protein FtsX